METRIWPSACTELLWKKWPVQVDVFDKSCKQWQWGRSSLPRAFCRTWFVSDCGFLLTKKSHDFNRRSFDRGNHMFRNESNERSRFWNMIELSSIKIVFVWLLRYIDNFSLHSFVLRRDSYVFFSNVQLSLVQPRYSLLWHNLTRCIFSCKSSIAMPGARILCKLSTASSMNWIKKNVKKIMQQFP